MSDFELAFLAPGGGKLEEGIHFVEKDGAWIEGASCAWGMVPSADDDLRTLDLPFAEAIEKSTERSSCCAIEDVRPGQAVIRNYCSLRRMLHTRHTGLHPDRSYRIGIRATRPILVSGEVRIEGENDWDLHYGYDVATRLGYWWKTRTDGWAVLGISNTVGRWVCLSLVYPSPVDGPPKEFHALDMLDPTFVGTVAIFPPSNPKVYRVESAFADPYN